MDTRNTMGAFGFGIAASLMFSIVNGLSTYLFKGDTVAEWATSKVGGNGGGQ